MAGEEGITVAAVVVVGEEAGGGEEAQAAKSINKQASAPVRLRFRILTFKLNTCGHICLTPGSFQSDVPARFL